MASETGWRQLGPPRHPAHPVAVPPFGRLARTHAFVMAGDALVTTAMAGSLFFSISPTAAQGRVMLSLLFTMAPFAVVAPFLGPVIDRSRAGRRLMIVATGVGRAVACVAMIRVLDGLLLFPAAFSVLVLSKTYSVARSALVPAVVDSDDMLVEANSKLAILGAIAGFVGSAPGLVFLRFADARWTLGLAVAVYVAGAVAGLRLPSPARDPAPALTPERAGAVAPFQVAIHLSAAAVATALLRAMVGFVTFLIAFGFRRADAPTWHFGVVLAASLAANLGGAALAPHVRTRVREELMLVVALAVVGVVGIAIARLDGILWATVVAAAVGLAAGLGKLAFDAVVQRDAHDTIRGRSFARFEAGFQLVWVVGALLPVIVATPLRQGYDVLGIAGITGAVAYALAYRHLGRAAV